MYSLIRNPLYLGNFFVMAAPILFFHTWWLCLIFVFAFILYYERIIVTEEAFLSQKFGDDYTRWASQTPAFFPRRFCWLKPDLPFAWRHVLRREYHGLLALIVAMVTLEFLSDISVHRSPVIDPFWLTILVIGTVFYLFVRFFAKYTRLLHVKGR